MNWFDPEDRSSPVISAEKQMRGGHRGYTVQLPETAVVFFMGYGMEVAAEYPSHILTEKFPRFLRPSPIGQFDTGNHACFINGGSAAPMAADTLECLAASGVKRVVVMGMCGAIAPEVNVGDVLLPPRVLVEEGTSLHYAQDAQWVCPDAALLERARAAFPEAKDKLLVSTDAVYRQTYRTEARWRNMGCGGVDMETSAMLCVGRALGVEVVALLVASDKHPEQEGDAPWGWHITREMREKFLRRGIDFALTL